MKRGPKLLILGLDGVGLDLVERFSAEGAMPNISSLIARGVSAPLLSTTPLTTLPAWTSFMTGAWPSSHGVADFTVRDGYRVRFIGAGSRRLPTLFSHLESFGLSAGSAWFPGTYPPERLSGYQISGWDSPVTSRGDSTFVHPAVLFEEMSRKFGPDHLSFDALDEFKADGEWYRRAASLLPDRIRRRAEIAAWLIENRPVDAAAFHFQEADTAAHHFFAFFDERSPRSPGRSDPILANALFETYRALDEAVGMLVEKAGEQASVVLLSDHGSCGASDVAVYLNRMLEKAGMLCFKPRIWPMPGHETLRGVLPSMMPAALRRGIFRFARGIVPQTVESYIRFSGIDWSRTVAFSEELTYAPSIWFNQLGREPKGSLGYRNRERAAREVERVAAKLVGDDGKAIVKQVLRREEIHRGGYAHLFPDLVVEFHKQDGYVPVCLPSLGTAGNPVTRLKGADLLGRKGRSMPGCHAEQGILVIVGKGVEGGTRTSAKIVDVAPALTALLGVPTAGWFEGERPKGVPESAESLGEYRADCREIVPSDYTAAERRIVSDRLRRLGYLDG